ncbi:MAG: LUD domain-containing protein, partial [Chloroflexota bacterium]
MQVQSKNFVSLADISLADESVQEAVNKGTNTAYNKRLAAMYAFGEAHGEALRAQGAEAKRRALRQLPELLEQADANMTENGMNVLWAEDAAEVRRMVMQIATRHEVTSVTKSKSMVTEEVGLNDALVEADLEVIETDLGEWILQLNDEPPSHIVTPVIHKTKQSIVDVFREHGYTGSDDANEMATYAREKLRAAFMESDMGISGGNFIIAETGSIGLVMNEGNGRMVTSLPNIHIAIVGLEKVVETIEDYTLLTQLISRSGTGQNMTVYNHTI